MTTPDIPDLLPCPFCRGLPELVQADNDPDWWIVKCVMPECAVSPDVQDIGREVVAAQWNARTPATPLEDTP